MFDSSFLLSCLVRFPPMEKKVKIFDKGQKLIRKHEMASLVYLIKSGEVVVYDILDNDRKAVVATLGPGQIVGELATLQQRNHSMYVEAKEKTETVAFDAGEFKKKIKESDPLVQALIKVLVERVTGTSADFLKAKNDDLYFDGDD